MTVPLLTASVNHSKNTMRRKHGFSPSQWVLGKDLRLPADLADDSEVSRIGAQHQVLSQDPVEDGSSRSFREDSKLRSFEESRIEEGEADKRTFPARDVRLVL